MKKRLLSVLVLFACFCVGGNAFAAPVSFQADNFSRGVTEDGQWAVQFDITATNNGDEGVVTRIYDVSFHIEANAEDLGNGNLERLYCDSNFAAPEGFTKLNLKPGDSAKASFAIPYVKFRGRWNWVGEEKNEGFNLAAFNVSEIRATVDPGGVAVGMSTNDFLALCRSGTPQEVAAAIKNGAEVNPNLSGMDDSDPPLMEAMTGNPDPEVVAVLLKNGADVNAKTFEGSTPLNVAINMSKPEFVRLLLENGADGNYTTYSGRSGLMNACTETANLEVVALLLDNGADINYQMDNGVSGMTVLMQAAESGSPELVSFLLDRGADAKLTTEYEKKTALDYAAKNEKLKNTDAYRRLKELTEGPAAKPKTEAAKTETPNDGSITLYPKDADLSEARDVIVEGNPPNLGGWKSDNAVVFQVNLKKAGMYRVVLLYSKQKSDGDEAKLTISARDGSVSVSGFLPFTGDDWSNYKEFSAASFDLPAGESRLRIESSEPDGGSYVMNLRSVRLTPASAAETKMKLSAAELKLMSTFLSNFTELGLWNFDAQQMAAADPPADLVRFGVWHNYTNSYKSRISRCKVKDCKWGGLTIDGKHVAESVKKYFGIDFQPVSVADSTQPFHYDGKLYHFEGADGEAVYYVRVSEAYKEDGSGHIRMVGELYNTDDPTDKPAQVEALAKPHKYGGKNTWAIISLRTEFYGDDKASSSGGPSPVIVDRMLAGVYEDGQWLAGEGEIYLDGKPVDRLNNKALEKKVMAADEAGKTLPVRMSRLQEGRELVYFTPEGKVGEGVINDAYLFYGGEASGVESGISFDGYEPEWRKLVIGVAQGIDAVPAPTVRSADGDGYTFSCDYRGTRYSVTLKPLEMGEFQATRVIGKLTVGKRSWDLEWGEGASVSWEGEDLECGFFDLDGDGSLELAVSSPGSNGNVSLFHADAENGPVHLAYIYTGEE